MLTFCLDDNYGWDDGLICGGRMTILADPLPHARRRSTTTAASASWSSAGRRLHRGGRHRRRRRGLPVGSRYLFDADGRARRPTSADGPVPEARAAQGLQPLAERPRPGDARTASPTCRSCRASRCSSSAAATSARRWPSWRPRSISTSGCSTTAHAYASRERFPTAQRLLVGDIGPTLKNWRAARSRPSTYCLIVTRGHTHDEEALYHLAPTAAGYVGMIGSKRKIKLIFEDLLAKGISPEALARVHAPLGFDIGSQTVPEIAISIVAELIACRNLGVAGQPHPPPAHPGG